METIIITGANSGIGYETAKHLANNGNKIIAATRNKPENVETIKQLNDWCKQEKNGGEVVFYDLDLGEFKSIQAFAEKILKDEETIDILICNAGIMQPPYRITVDGFESQFQVNYLGHFLLTQLLIDRISKAKNPKIINVCSASAESAKIHDINSLERMSHVSEAQYKGLISYRESKLAQQVTVMQMSRMPEFAKIKLSALHPGVVNSNLFYVGKSGLYKAIMSPFVAIARLTGALITPEKGAQTSIFLAENNNYPTGGYWHNDRQIRMNPISEDADYGKLVYDWANTKIEKPNLA